MRSLLAFLFVLPSAALAQSGLNNIPSADTTPQGTWVPQVSTTIGHDHDADLKFGLKTGLTLGSARAEAGFSSTVYPGKGGPMKLHAKLALPMGEHWPVIALGVANITTESRYRDRVGEAYYYAVLSHDLEWFRLHAGCALQEGAVLPFFGIDKTFYKDRAPSAKSPVEIKPRPLFTVRLDVMEQTSHDWVWAVGGLVPICDFLNFESWANFSTDGSDPTLVLKANFYVRF